MEMAGLNGLGTAQGNGRLRVRVPVRPMVRFFLFSLVTEGGRGREREGEGRHRSVEAFGPDKGSKVATLQLFADISGSQSAWSSSSSSIP